MGYLKVMKNLCYEYIDRKRNDFSVFQLKLLISLYTRMGTIKSHQKTDEVFKNKNQNFNLFGITMLLAYNTHVTIHFCLISFT